ncbi:MAG: hypothetical protein PHV00_05945 [Syntrophales bacterium]|jgi:hypothetical protein|nr:hypothetical protein [Syntrophales bacterium]
MADYDMTDLMLRLRDILSESSAVYWSDDELEDIINDVQREIAELAGCYQTIDSDLATVAATRTVSNLGACYRVNAVELIQSASRIALRKILPRQIGRVANLDQAAPQCWYEFGSTIGIDPLPAAEHTLHAYLTAPPPEISPAPNLQAGTEPEGVATDDFIYYLSDTKYAAAAVPAGTALTGSAIPLGKYGAWRLEIGADGTLDMVAATDNATGYASAALALAGLPTLQSAHVAVGTVTVTKSDGIFTPGTTSLTATGVTAAFTDDIDLATTPAIPKQFWLVLLLGALARALAKNPQTAAAAQMLETLYASEMRFHAYDFQEQAPDAYSDLRYE